MHIALLGGRFDPPHNGHIQIARYILQEMPVIDLVWLTPANTHPWRQIIASARNRLAMAKLLEEKNIHVSDLDIERGGDTYTIDTIRILQEQTQHTYYWICGSDQIPYLKKWKNYEELQKRMQFIIIPRKGYQHIQGVEKCIVLSENYQPTSLSSSEIRDRIQKGLPITNFVPEKIAAYIQKKGLYGIN